MSETQVPPVVDNRRSFCEHCSLRTDLPGFITGEHAQANIDRIKAGEFFACHMIYEPTKNDAPNRACLGAALIGRAELANRPTATETTVYPTPEAYILTHATGRLTNNRLLTKEQWRDRHGDLWFGWWAQAPAGNWRYLFSSPEANEMGSGYFFLDQMERLYGPLQRAVS